MNDLLKQLKAIGFSDEYLKAIEDQKFVDVLPSKNAEAEYMLYNPPVEYMTESSLENFSYKEE